MFFSAVNPLVNPLVNFWCVLFISSHSAFLFHRGINWAWHKRIANSWDIVSLLIQKNAACQHRAMTMTSLKIIIIITDNNTKHGVCLQSVAPLKVLKGTQGLRWKGLGTRQETLEYAWEHKVTPRVFCLPSQWDLSMGKMWLWRHLIWSAISLDCDLN